MSNIQVSSILSNVFTKYELTFYSYLPDPMILLTVIHLCTIYPLSFSSNNSTGNFAFLIIKKINLNNKKNDEHFTLFCF